MSTFGVEISLAESNTRVFKTRSASTLAPFRAAAGVMALVLAFFFAQSTALTSGDSSARAPLSWRLSGSFHSEQLSNVPAICEESDPAGSESAGNDNARGIATAFNARAVQVDLFVRTTASGFVWVSGRPYVTVQTGMPRGPPYFV